MQAGKHRRGRCASEKTMYRVIGVSHTGDSCPPSDGTVSSSTTGKAIENTPTLLDQSTTLVVANDLPTDNCEAGQTEVVETEAVENVTQHELSDTVPKQVDDHTHVSTGVTFGDSIYRSDGH